MANFLGDQQSYYLQVFKDFANHRKKTDRGVNTGATGETFQQSGKQDSFRHLLKSSAGM